MNESRKGRHGTAPVQFSLEWAPGIQHSFYNIPASNVSVSEALLFLQQIQLGLHILSEGGCYLPRPVFQSGGAGSTPRLDQALT